MIQKKEGMEGKNVVDHEPDDQIEDDNKFIAADATIALTPERCVD